MNRLVLSTTLETLISNVTSPLNLEFANPATNPMNLTTFTANLELLYSHFIFATLDESYNICVSEDSLVLAQQLIDKKYYQMPNLILHQLNSIFCLLKPT